MIRAIVLLAVAAVMGAGRQTTSDEMARWQREAADVTIVRDNLRYRLYDQHDTERSYHP